MIAGNCGSDAADEGAVDLQAEDGQLAQVHQSRVPGSEVVNGTPDPKVAQVEERFAGRIEIVYEDALADLELEHSRIQPMAGEGIHDPCADASLCQLAGGEVHGYRDLSTVSVVPALQVSTCLLEHPVTHREDQAGLFGKRDERRRSDEAEVGVTPARERFEADNRAGPGINLRLEM